MNMDKKHYDAEYHKKNIKGVYIPFNMVNPDDEHLFKLLNRVKNKTQFIKDLLAVELYARELFDEI